MNTFKKITLTSAVAFALFTFNACGDDSNSTSASGENGSLSSAVEDEESSSSINGDTSSVIPVSSSSVVSDSEGSSSSVKGSDTADVSSSSVISDPDRESSSSSVKSSSSSAKSSSSVNSSSSVKSSSSSSVKQSSSSVAKSSSSGEYVPFDHSKTLAGAYQVGEDAYHQFTDERNGRSYYYITIAGKDTSGNAASVTVMAENLNIGEMVRGRKNQEDNDKIERYCYNNDTTNCDRYGGLYQWAEMMQLPSDCNQKDCRDQYDTITYHHKGICPDGWRLLTYNDFYIVVHADGNTHGVEGVRSTFGFGGYNTTGYSLVGAGIRVDGSFKDLNEAAYWFFPSENPIENFAAGDDCYMGAFDKTINKNVSYKSNGLSVRCVMVE